MSVGSVPPSSIVGSLGVFDFCGPFAAVLVWADSSDIRFLRSPSPACFSNLHDMNLKWIQWVWTFDWYCFTHAYLAYKQHAQLFWNRATKLTTKSRLIGNDNVYKDSKSDGKPHAASWQRILPFDFSCRIPPFRRCLWLLSPEAAVDWLEVHILWHSHSPTLDCCIELAQISALKSEQIDWLCLADKSLNFVWSLLPSIRCSYSYALQEMG